MEMPVFGRETEVLTVYKIKLQKNEETACTDCWLRYGGIVLLNVVEKRTEKNGKKPLTVRRGLLR